MDVRRLPRGSRLAWIACSLLALAAGAFFVFSGPVRIAPAPRAGFVDLSHWNFARDGSARLAGQWLYFDGRWARDVHVRQPGGVTAHVPGPWPIDKRNGKFRANGFGTYTLTLKLPAAPASDSFAIDTGQVHSAYRLYANDKLIAQGGTPAATASAERADGYSSLGTLSPTSQLVRLKLEISNHVNRYGGIFLAASVGAGSALAQHRHTVEMLQLIAVGALIFAAFYHFAFHGIVRGGRAHLWFGLLAALQVVRDFLIEPLARGMVPLIGQDWVWRVDFTVTALALPAAYWFLALSFPRHLSSRVGVGLSALCVAAAIVSLAGGSATGDIAFKSVELMACITVVFLTQAIVRSVLENEKGAGLALIGWLLISIAIVHDTLVDNLFIAGDNILPFGCIAFFLCVSGALTTRSQAAFEKVENLSASLKSLNAHLETVVDERTVELRQKIAELETQQIALEQSRAAAVSANETKSRFLANMSHELRTPLNAILGFSEIIHNRLFGNLVERYSDYAADIHASGRRLLALIDDILDLSKIEAGKLELRCVRLDLDSQIRAAMRLVESRAASKSVRLAFEPDTSQEIVADERALQQILVNLLTNAVKFTRAGGEVRASARSETDSSVVITIEDTGIGIKPEDMARVLQSFGQGRHDIVATNERGTGLGLPIVKGLVEAHGGALAIESTVGRGTKAIVSFPPQHAIREQRRTEAA